MKQNCYAFGKLEFIILIMIVGVFFAIAANKYSQIKDKTDIAALQNFALTLKQVITSATIEYRVTARRGATSIDLDGNRVQVDRQGHPIAVAEGIVEALKAIKTVPDFKIRYKTKPKQVLFYPDLSRKNCYVLYFGAGNVKVIDKGC